MKESQAIPLPLRFGFGTVSAVGATIVTHPVDVVKYAQQLNRTIGSSAFSNAKTIFQNSGFKGFYNGLPASMLRQMSYGTTRLGLYQTLIARYTSADGAMPPLWQKLSFSIAAGGIGAFVGNPFDLALVRMAADGSLPKEQRRNYSGVNNALSRIIRQEGFLSLWTGASPTIYRSIALNMAQLTSYTQAKEELLRTSYFEDNLITHVTASMIAGLVATTVSTPFDVAKTRIQQDVAGEFRGMSHCLLSTVRKEGFFSAWKGFGPSYLRLAPQTILVFVILEQLQHGYRTWVEVPV